MKIRVICVGFLKENYFREAEKEYLKRLSSYAEVTIEEIQDLPIPERASSSIEENIKEKEGEKILSKIKSNSFVIALDLKGEQYESPTLAKELDKWFMKGGSVITFVIGGSLGLSEKAISRANAHLCLSKMTFTHQMSRIILLEQIYRSFRINRGEPYHK